LASRKVWLGLHRRNHSPRSKTGKHLSHQDGRVKILDFGLAKLDPSQTTIAEADTATLEQQTGPGQVLGTVGYISPEQIRGQAAGARSDIFALGRTRCLSAGAPSKSQPRLRR
jgi:serine/threonine protein kinase